MNTKNNCPFESVKIQIVELNDIDIITASPTRDPFEGEEDIFPTSWRDISDE